MFFVVLFVNICQKMGFCALFWAKKLKKWRFSAVFRCFFAKKGAFCALLYKNNRQFNMAVGGV